MELPSSPPQLTYGRGRYGLNPIAFSQLSLCPDTLRLLREDAIFLSALSLSKQDREEHLKSMGYQQNVDYPLKVDHVYYEAYLHSLPQLASCEALHPRIGLPHPKHHAPLRLTAFCESVRRKNRQWSSLLEQKLRQLPGMVAKIMIDVIENNRLFGDLAVQLHYGEEISKDEVRYHVDALNSLLHMGISVAGKRDLLWKACTQPSLNDADFKLVTSEQHAGNIYISYPCAMEHAPAYPPCTFEDPIIAVQCRCLLTNEQYEEMCMSGIDDVRAVIAVVHNALSNGLALPDDSTLENIQPPSQEQDKVAVPEGHAKLADQAALDREAISSSARKLEIIHFALPTTEEVRLIVDELRPQWELCDDQNSIGISTGKGWWWKAFLRRFQI